MNAMTMNQLMQEAIDKVPAIAAENNGLLWCFSVVRHGDNFTVAVLRANDPKPDIVAPVVSNWEDAREMEVRMTMAAGTGCQRIGRGTIISSVEAACNAERERMHKLKIAMNPPKHRHDKTLGRYREESPPAPSYPHHDGFDGGMGRP